MMIERVKIARNCVSIDWKLPGDQFELQLNSQLPGRDRVKKAE